MRIPQRPCLCVAAAQQHTGVDQAEEKQHHLHEHVPFVLVVMRRVIIRRIGEELELARFVRQEPDDGDERQCGVDATSRNQPERRLTASRHYFSAAAS
jgi:hypothetical protein